MSHTPQSVVALGTFDGVHLGHQKIIDSLLFEAKSQHLKPIIVTFFPHPTHVLTPDKPLKMINSIEERIKLLNKKGIKNVVVHEFTKDFSKKSALSFIMEELIAKLNMKCLIVGYDHSFGRGKEGDFDTLVKYGESLGFCVKQIAAYQVKDTITSSTVIRNLLNEGKIENVQFFSRLFILSIWQSSKRQSTREKNRLSYGKYCVGLSQQNHPQNRRLCSRFRYRRHYLLRYDEYWIPPYCRWQNKNDRGSLFWFDKKFIR